MKKGSKGGLIYMIRESDVIRNDWSGDILTCIWTEFPGIEFMRSQFWSLPDTRGVQERETKWKAVNRLSFQTNSLFRERHQTSTRVNAVFD